MQVRRKKGIQNKHVVEHRIADIRGGVGVKTANLGGTILKEGTVLGKPIDGLCEVVKFAKVIGAVAADAAKIDIEKGHHFKEGDAITIGENDVAATIKKIDRTAAKDTLTVNAALGGISEGGFVVEAAGESKGESALKVLPFAVNGTDYEIKAGDNIFTDAWIFAITRNNPLPEVIAKKLPTVVNI